MHSGLTPKRHFEKYLTDHCCSVKQSLLEDVFEYYNNGWVLIKVVRSCARDSRCKWVKILTLVRSANCTFYFLNQIRGNMRLHTLNPSRGNANIYWIVMDFCLIFCLLKERKLASPCSEWDHYGGYRCNSFRPPRKTLYPLINPSNAEAYFHQKHNDAKEL